MATSYAFRIPTMAIPTTPVSLKSIIDMLGDRMVELFTIYCKDSIASGAASGYAAGLIKQGMHQSNPVKDRISILVNPDNPDDMTSKTVFSDMPSNRDDSLARMKPTETTYEIGGGEEWTRRFRVDIDVYLTQTKESENEARRIGLWVFGRAQQAIRENPALGMTDDFGETALFWRVVNVNPWTAGGPPNSFIWRGALFVEAVTRSSETYP